MSLQHHVGEQMELNNKIVITKQCEKWRTIFLCSDRDKSAERTSSYWSISCDIKCVLVEWVQRGNNQMKTAMHIYLWVISEHVLHSDCVWGYQTVSFSVGWRFPFQKYCCGIQWITSETKWNWWWHCVWRSQDYYEVDWLYIFLTYHLPAAVFYI